MDHNRFASYFRSRWCPQSLGIDAPRSARNGIAASFRPKVAPGATGAHERPRGMSGPVVNRDSEGDVHDLASQSNWLNYSI